MSKRKIADIVSASTSVSVAALGEDTLLHKLKAGTTYNSREEVKALVDIFNSREVRTAHSCATIGCYRLLHSPITDCAPCTCSYNTYPQTKACKTLNSSLALACACVVSALRWSAKGKDDKVASLAPESLRCPFAVTLSEKHAVNGQKLFTIIKSVLTHTCSTEDAASMEQRLMCHWLCMCATICMYHDAYAHVCAHL